MGESLQYDPKLLGLLFEKQEKYAEAIKDHDRISVYPVFESLDITPLLCVRPAPLRETRFILDTHLGRLAAYLRMLGFDTLYRNDTQDEELAMLSSKQKRILLTRDRGLLKRSLVTHGYYIRETSPRRQLVEVMRRFDLSSSIQPFRRCIRCNHLLQPVNKEIVAEHLPPSTRANHQEFQRCTSCGRVYWKGSHYERMAEFVHRIEKLQSRPMSML